LRHDLRHDDSVAIHARRYLTIQDASHCTTVFKTTRLR
jgi:hypothetical protein